MHIHDDHARRVTKIYGHGCSCSKELPKNLTSKNAEIGKLKYKYEIQNSFSEAKISAT